MRKGKGENDHGEREPTEPAQRNLFEVLVDEIAEEKSSPENLFQKRDDHDEAQKAKPDRFEIEGRAGREDFGIKAIRARRKSEPCLGRDPQKKNEKPYR